MAKIRKGISCDRPPLNGGPNLNHRSHCNGEYVDRHIHRLYVCPIFIPHWMHNCTCTNIYNLQPRIIKLLKHHEGLPQNVINIQCGDFPKRGYIPPNIHFSLGCSSQETIYWGQPLPRWLAMALCAWNPCATRMMRSAKCWRCRKTSRDPLGVSNGSVMLFFLHEVWWFNVIQWWSNESNGMNGDL